MRVIYHQIDSAELLRRTRNKRIHLRRFANIRFHAKSLSTAGHNVLLKLGGQILILQISEADGRAFSSELAHDRVPDASSSAGNDRYFSFKSHSSIPQVPAYRRFNFCRSARVALASTRPTSSTTTP